MHVLIPEFKLTGHHGGYLAQIVDAMLEVASTVAIAVNSTDMPHQVLEEIGAKHKSRVEVLRVQSSDRTATATSKSPLLRELQYYFWFKRAFKIASQRRRVDFVFVPYLDYCLHAVGLIGSPFSDRPWSGITMRAGFHRRRFGIGPSPKFSGVRERLFGVVARSKSLVRLFAIDELVVKHLAGQAPKLSYLRDPAEIVFRQDQVAARQALQLPPQAKILLVFGAISSRKGIDVLLTCLGTENWPRDVHVLIVGRHDASDSVQPYIDKVVESELRERLTVIDEFVDEFKEQLVFSAADGVWLGYRGHYEMSGVLVLAAKARKRTLGTRDGLIGYYIEKYRLGRTFNIDSRREVSDALRWFADGDDLEADYGELDSHTWDGFRTSVAEAVRPVSGGDADELGRAVCG